VTSSVDLPAAAPFNVADVRVCMIPDDGGEDSSWLCGWADDTTTCDDEARYSVRRSTYELWSALCPLHTAWARRWLPDCEEVRDARPRGVVGEMEREAVARHLAGRQQVRCA
jgi:hypothetical protein